MNEIQKNLDGKGLRIGIVMSRFNIDVSEGLLSACEESLLKNGVAAKKITLTTVPGALEIPITLKVMAQSSRYDALIALGAVIRGETYHFDIVANESAAGLACVQRECCIPVANGILTLENEEQGLARMSAKGADAALVAIEMANLLKQIK
jgi:6,7-dimethyl-8-ribityllumazine synthase